MLRKSIFSKIFALVILVSFVLSISVFLVALREQSKKIEEALSQEGRLFAKATVEDIESGNLINILPKKTTPEVASSKDVLFILVVQPDGKVYFSDKPEMIGKTIRDPSLGTKTTVVKNSFFSGIDEKIKLVVCPLKMGNEGEVWSLFVGISLKSIIANRRKMIIVSSGIFALLLVLFALVSFCLAKRVTDPLEKLKKSAGIIGRGNFDYRIKLKTGDEIEDLGIAFNRMAESLKNYYFKLKEEKDKTLAIINNLADGVLVFDKNKKILLVNPRAEEFFGLQEKEIIGKSLGSLSMIVILKPLTELLAKKKRIFREEIKIKEGLTLEASRISITKEGEELNVLIILHDVTREKLIEKMKTDFVSLSAHQLRTPLSGMKWAIKMILEGDLGKLNKEQKDFMEGVYESNERMICLVRDLLNVARIEEGKYLYRLSLGDIGQIVQREIDGYKNLVKQKKLKVEIKRPKKILHKVMADVEKMKIAVRNIFNNAIKYTSPGGKIIISLKGNEKEIEVQIADTGLGIPQHEQEKVFTKFFRGTNIKKIDTEGTGLGLYITKNIIEAHGGRIWFKSKENKGTTFYFTIPVKKEFAEFVGGKFY